MNRLRKQLPKEFQHDYRTKTEKQVYRIVRAARHNIRQKHKDSEDLQDHYIYQEYARADLDKGTSTVTQQKKRINAKAQRKLNQTIAAALPSKRSQSTLTIEVSDDWDDDDSPRTQYSDKDDVKKWASYHINTNFRQVYNTPTEEERFQQDFGLLSTTPAAEEVLQGVYDPPMRWMNT